MQFIWAQYYYKHFSGGKLCTMLYLSRSGQGILMNIWSLHITTNCIALDQCISPHVQLTNVTATVSMQQTKQITMNMLLLAVPPSAHHAMMRIHSGPESEWEQASTSYWCKSVHIGNMHVENHSNNHYIKVSPTVQASPLRTVYA